MEILSHIIEWIGVLFLSIEAIKLDNLKRLIPILHSIRMALNAPYFKDDKTGQTMMPMAPEGCEWLRKYADYIIYALGSMLIATFLLTTHLLPVVAILLNQYVWVFSGVSWYRVMLSLFLSWCLIWVPFYAGNELVIYFCIFADKYYRLMNVLEEYTFNGIIGIIGFLLVTISTIANIATH
jgi:hypothetical protein